MLGHRLGQHKHLYMLRYGSANNSPELFCRHFFARRRQQCECAVSSGLNAMCKHVGIVLLGVAHHTSNGAKRTYVLSTQKLQSFHAARPHTGSPIKAQNLPLQRDKISKWTSDPRPARCRIRHQSGPVTQGRQSAEVMQHTRTTLGMWYWEPRVHAPCRCHSFFLLPTSELWQLTIHIRQPALMTCFWKQKAC